jgi:hypothetical protein
MLHKIHIQINKTLKQVLQKHLVQRTVFKGVDLGYPNIFIYSTTTLSSVLKPKYSLSIRNKCVYLLESSETSITIWRQEYPQNYYI